MSKTEEKQDKKQEEQKEVGVKKVGNGEETPQPSKTSTSEKNIVPSTERTINRKTLKEIKDALKEEFPEEEHYERSGFTYISGDAVKNRLMNVLGNNLDIIMVRETIIQNVPMKVKGRVENHVALQSVVELAIYYDLLPTDKERVLARRVQGVGGSAKQLGLSPLTSMDSLAKSARTYAMKNAAEVLGVAFYLRTEQLIEQAVDDAHTEQEQKSTSKGKGTFPNEIVDMFSELKKDTGCTSDDILSFAMDFNKKIKSLKYFTVRENATKKEINNTIKEAEELVEYIKAEV